MPLEVFNDFYNWCSYLEIVLVDLEVLYAFLLEFNTKTKPVTATV